MNSSADNSTSHILLAKEKKKLCEHNCELSAECFAKAISATPYHVKQTDCREDAKEVTGSYSKS
jgi:hypothetical protein